MIALDTNVLVRLFVDDDAAQGDLAEAALARCTPEDPGFVAREVALELVWVLERAYRLSRGSIADLLEGLLASHDVVVEAAEAVEAAAALYRLGGDFADAMIAEAARGAGAAAVVTFDRKFAGRIATELL